MTNPSTTGTLTAETRKRLSAYEKKTKSWSYARKSLWKKRKTGIKDFWKPSEDTKQFFHIFTWIICALILSAFIVWCFYWAIEDLLFK